MIDPSGTALSLVSVASKANNGSKTLPVLKALSVLSVRLPLPVALSLAPNYPTPLLFSTVRMYFMVRSPVSDLPATADRPAERRRPLALWLNIFWKFQ